MAEIQPKLHGTTAAIHRQRYSRNSNRNKASGIPNPVPFVYFQF
jgi:hypothetical protein